MQAKASFRDFIEPGEVIHRSVTDFCELMESKGWVPQKRAEPRGIRYWCTCNKTTNGHTAFVSTTEMTQQRIDFLWRATCLSQNN